MSTTADDKPGHKIGPDHGRGHDEALIARYEAGDEDGRMADASNGVEWERTVTLLGRWLPPAPARVLDIGGGPGRYAEWLCDRGYSVTLLDPVPKHVAQAQARGLDAVLGDARSLPFEDASAEAVVMMGPLYHLPSAPDRLLALREAVRCARPSGVVVAAAISRWSKPIVRAAQGRLREPGTHDYLLRVLEDGRDPDGAVFYLHDPVELREELAAAGLADVLVLGVEGPLGAYARLDASLSDTAIEAARIAESAAPHSRSICWAGASGGAWRPRDR
jgi:SAM-dependent methyltransferase